MRAHKAVCLRYFKINKKHNCGVMGIKMMALLNISASAHCTNSTLPAQGVQLYQVP